MSVAGVLVCALPAFADGWGDWYPSLYGAVEAPKTVSSGASFSYTVTGTDKDMDYEGVLVGDLAGFGGPEGTGMDPETIEVSGGPEYDEDDNLTGNATYTVSGDAITVTEETFALECVAITDGDGVGNDGVADLDQTVVITP